MVATIIKVAQIKSLAATSDSTCEFHRLILFLLSVTDIM